ncbi:hypothetical protein [Mucilaginibacter pedocola]|uniref:Uncharacterized protein n=1 Tax=Mucilaginibacter pedocola TaxID=1792845 RepID=A0A1S9PGG8_9SPHI|nr:hypothetical protein [Mucilaginibacter pedocola]OOQ60050.1 hypothetical protein BC343_27365 [Mucilaginibacter pedocola]
MKLSVIAFCTILSTHIFFQKRPQYFFPQLDGTKKEIELAAKQYGAVLKYNKQVPKTKTVAAHSELAFVFPKLDKDDVYLATYYLNAKGECFQQNLYYGSNEFLNHYINQFDNPKVNFNRVGQNLKWEGKFIELELIKSPPRLVQGNQVLYSKLSVPISPSKPEINNV